MLVRMIGAILILVALVGVGCKSVNTTSAILHNQSGRYDLAIETANAALAENPNDAEAEFQLGIAYSYLDSVGAAYEHFVRSYELEPKREKDARNNIQSNFARHYNVALNLLQDDDYYNAAVEFEKATLADPTEAKGFFQLGTTYTFLGDEAGSEGMEYYDKSVVCFDRVLELANPSDVHYIDALSYAGQVLAKSGKPEEAVSRFNRLVEEDPTNYRVIEKIGYDRLDEKDWKGAAVFLDLAAQARAKIGAEDFNLFYNLGVAHFQLGKGDETAGIPKSEEELTKSIEYYESALDLNLDEPQTIRNIVVAYVFLEDWRMAAEWGERYVGVAPDEPDGWRLLTRCYNELGDKEKARRCELRYDELRQRESSTQ
jgi:tetratricopeptide (TPR) repeat protein